MNRGLTIAISEMRLHAAKIVSKSKVFQGSWACTHPPHTLTETYTYPVYTHIAITTLSRCASTTELAVQMLMFD
ncbi:hypothetical protein KIN20_001260 [Parelaphostrongylus tenuis]|uniref:Uncharacterized protein n=1 Tax=Parelaphostrongylus tenuis TaxID=148309 RepID=A0AAD5LTV0_PARTN|nr:hypothetical protein KIN20_001260 [Parelaphostrongylus tenuis]